MEKTCEICKEKYQKHKKFSQTQWANSRFCSCKCSSVHAKSLPKRTGWKHKPETIKKMIENNPSRGRFTSGSYGSVHNWLGRNFTHLKIKCDHCEGKKFLEFALKQNHRHEHKIENYLILCSSCHKKYDYTYERRIRLSNALKGRVIHWADKISEANRGRILSEEHRKIISDNMKIINKSRPRNKNGRFVKTKKI